MQGRLTKTYLVQRHYGWLSEGESLQARSPSIGGCARATCATREGRSAEGAPAEPVASGSASDGLNGSKNSRLERDQRAGSAALVGREKTPAQPAWPTFRNIGSSEVIDAANRTASRQASRDRGDRRSCHDDSALMWPHRRFRSLGSSMSPASLHSRRRNVNGSRDRHRCQPLIDQLEVAGRHAFDLRRPSCPAARAQVKHRRVGSSPSKDTFAAGRGESAAAARRSARAGGDVAPPRSDASGSLLRAKAGAFRGRGGPQARITAATGPRPPRRRHSGTWGTRSSCGEDHRDQFAHIVQVAARGEAEG